jgi:transcriptional regulator with XRE-family HTH domain
MQQARQEARNGRGFTQQELASLLGVSSVTLSRWETGARNPSFELLERFAQMVEKPLSFFFEEEPQEDEYAQMLLRITDQLGEEEKQDVLAYARFRYERWYESLDHES